MSKFDININLDLGKACDLKDRFISLLNKSIRITELLPQNEIMVKGTS